MFDKYPYTDFHELNLDWIIATVKQLKVSVEGIELDNVTIHEQLNSIVAQLDNVLGIIHDEVARQIQEADIPGIVDIAMIPYINTLNDALREVNRLEDEVNNIKIFVDSWDEQLNQLRSDYTLADTVLKNDYQTRDAIIYADLLEKIAIIQTEIDNLEWELPEVYNLVKGYRTNIVNVIYDVYDAVRYFAYTAIQYTNAGLTASELDGLNKQALDLDVNGYTILYPPKKCLNPLTGIPADICAIVQDLALFASERTWTALIWDSTWEQDADTIDALDITAFNFDYTDSAAPI